MADAQTQAAAMFDAFERRTRDNGEAFYAFREGSPDWMSDVAHAAHGDLMPDDWRYGFIRQLCSAIADSDDLDDARGEIVDGCVDVYTAQLTAWLASNVARLGYCDAAAEELGKPDTLCDWLKIGQYAEIDETFGQLIEALEQAPDSGVGG